MDAALNDFFREIGDINPNLSEFQQQNQVAKVERLHSYEVAGTSWVPCFDSNTGCPYYWNQLTNEVCWQPPPEYIAAVHAARKRQEAEAVAPIKDIKPAAKIDVKKARPKYPWEDNTDSEDEKVELITSFGPKSDEESEEEIKIEVKAPPKRRLRPGKPRKKSVNTQKQLVGLQPTPQSSAAEEQSEIYETSSLLTPFVDDQGPPGDEVSRPILNGKEKIQASNKERVDSVSNNSVPSPEDQLGATDCADILSRLKNKAKMLEKMGGDVPSSVKLYLNSPQDSPKEDESNIAVLETEENSSNIEGKVGSSVNSFALIANYGDDSDSEETNTPDKGSAESKPLFPSVVFLEENSAPKHLFPCVEESSLKPTKPPSPSIGDVGPVVETPSTINLKSTEKPSTSNFNPTEVEDATALKAFKRKRRIEIETPKEPQAKYNMDPSSNEHRGFGFTSLGFEIPTKKTDPSSSSTIDFVKGETIDFNPPFPKREVKDSTVIVETYKEGESPVREEDIGDLATLLREKLLFLGEGKEEVSAVQLMAIQLETLVFAWQQGALTPAYLSQWLISRAAELTENEQTAAPPGWTCSWDRERRRYSYRHEVTGEIVWDYPETVPEPAASAEPPVVKESLLPEEPQEIAMELSDTPPRVSPVPPSPEPEREPSPPPPPVISRRRFTPPPPPSPPSITLLDGPTYESAAVPSSLRDAPLISCSAETDYHDEPLPPGVEEVDLVMVAVKPPPLPPEQLKPPEPDDLMTQPDGIPGVELSEARKRALLSELDSFYSDIAQIEGFSSTVPSKEDAPKTEKQTFSTSASTKLSKQNETSVEERPPVKKRKTGKLNTGLALKKKGVTKLVAKWVKVQNEARETDDD